MKIRFQRLHIYFSLGGNYQLIFKFLKNVIVLDNVLIFWKDKTNAMIIATIKRLIQNNNKKEKR